MMARKKASNKRNQSKAAIKNFYLIPRILFIIIFAFSGLGAQAPSHVHAEDPGWTAYNDSAWESGQPSTNITTYTIEDESSGVLKNYATGEDTPVTVTFASAGNPAINTGTYGGTETDAGTDAYNAFHDIVDVAGVIQYGDSGWYVDMTFTGLDPARTYTFATTANRDGDYTDRFTRFTLSGVDAAVNQSSSGVTVNSDLSVSFNTGNNTTSGYVAKWVNIQPGSDGQFVVRSEAEAGAPDGKAYGPSVFLLQQEAIQTTDPTLTTAGALQPFRATPGEPSEPQSYTVSGIDLTDDVTITPPQDFELSLSGVDGFSSNPLVLSATDGILPTTTIYVRFLRSSDGASSGNITHSSTGASTQDVAVSGETVAVVHEWTAYNDSAWESGQPSTNITTFTIEDETTGLLKDYATGNETTVTVTYTAAGDPAINTGTYGGSEPDAGTDAYNTFHGIVDTAGVIQYGDSGWYVDLTFTGLDPSRTYTFATTANRDGDYDDRFAKFTLSGVDAAVNQSSSGVVVNGELSVSFNTGNNTATGYVAKWANIQPGTDGEFVVRAEADVQAPDGKAYGPSVFMLHEEAIQTTDPTLTTSGALQPFSTAPGVPSEPQSYTVSGINLTETVTITPPADFEISLSSSEGFTSGPLVLTPTDGRLSATTIYVRFLRASDGASSGSITHISTGAGQQDVAVSGETANEPVCVTSRIAASADDAEERADNGAVDLDGDTSTHSLQMFRAYAGGSSGTLNWWGMRFSNVDIPQGAVITSADITFHANNDSNSTEGAMTFWGELAANPTTFTTGTSNISDRSRTTASANWNVPAWVNGSDYVSPSLNGIIQEIVDQLDWDPNNAMVIMGETTAEQNRRATSYDGTDGSSLAPQLEVCYSLAVGPNIKVTDGITPFATSPGVPSDPQNYTVTGTNLAADISVVAPEGFEISTDAVNFYPSLSLPHSSGMVDSVVVYVRLTGASVGTFTGDIVHTSEGADTRNVTVSGAVELQSTSATFQYGANGYTGTIDTFIRGSTNGAVNYSTETGLEWDENSGTTTDEYTLIRFTELFTSEGGPIPDGSTITSATLTYMTTDLSSSSTAEGDPANVYEILTDWDGSTVTYNNFGSTAGVQSEDYRSTPVITALAEERSTAYNIDVTESLERWSLAPTENLGWVFVPTNTDGVTIYSSDHATVSYHPLLSVSYYSSDTCFALTLTHSGEGSDPAASPLNSETCDPGYYLAGEAISLSGAVPAAGWEIAGWTGASNNASTADSNSLIMPPTPHTVSVIYEFINDAPYAPVLVQPLDDATGVGASPTLSVSVTDPDANALDVSFYGRQAGSGDGEDFTLIVIPDTQNHVSNLPEAFNAMTNYVVDNFTADNIMFVTHVGDIVNTSNDTTQWQRADTAMDILDAADVPYSVGPGNHDLAIYSGTSYYNDYFGPSRFEGNGYYQGPSASGKNENNYSFFSAGGMDFILINLQYNPTADHLNWADALLKANPDRRGIIAQHNILNTDNSWQFQATFTALKNNPNLFLMLCGHMHSTNDGSAYRAETGDAGQTIHVLLTDYQDYNNTSNTGYLRILRFSPADDKIYASIYSPYTGTSLTSESNYEQFAMDYDMEGSATFELIGTAEDVASGTVASSVWAGLDQDIEYEWYTEISDGYETTTGPVWSFTTTGTANAAPVLNPVGNHSVAEGEPLNFTVTATDTDLPAQPLFFSVEAGTGGVVPAWASIGESSGLFDWTPAENQGPGTYTFDICVSDGSLKDCETVQVIVNEVNVAPELGAIGNKSVNEGTLLGFTATVTDPDLPGNFHSFSLEAGTNGAVPAGAAIEETIGVFNWIPTEQQGPNAYTFDICVSDGALKDCETIEVTVNEVNSPPVLDEIGSKVVDEETQLSFVAAATDTDAPAAAPTFSLVNGASGSIPTGASINETTGVFNWTPTEVQGPGTYTFDVCASDGTLDDCETIEVTVNEVNVAPVLGQIGNQSVDENALMIFTASAADTDLPAQTLSFSLADGTSGSVPEGSIIDENTGVFQWTPDEAQGPGTYTFDVCTSDGALNDCETIEITVNEINVSPVLDQIGNQSVSEGELLTFTATASDADVPDQILSFSLADGASGDVPDGAAIDASSGVFNWIPSVEQGPNTYIFDVCVHDGEFSDCETIQVAVGEDNTAPVLGEIGNQSVNEGELLSFTATATDADLPAQTLAFSLADGSSGSVPAGAGIDESSGVFSWTPTETQGPDDYTFDICVSDGELADCETIQVTVNEVNVAPVLDAIGSQSVNENALLSFTASASDADDPEQTLSFSLADGAAGAVPDGANIGASSGHFIWSPTEVQGPGTYTFDVCTSDGVTGTCETIEVTVDEVNLAPALDEIGSKSVNEGEPLIFTAAAVDSDLPAQTLTYSIADGISGAIPEGATMDAGTGEFNWIPAEEQGPGDYIFDVCVSDGLLNHCETIQVTVNEINVAPVLDQIGNQTVNEGETLGFTATASDTDLPAHFLTFSLKDGASGAVPPNAYIDEGYGIFSWNTTEEQGPGVYTFDICVSDSALEDCETIQVTVLEDNVAPVLDQIGNKEVNEGDLLTFTATASDSDLPDQPLSFSLEDGVSGNVPDGATINASSGVFSWTPGFEQGPGAYTFDVCVSDGLLSDCETIRVTVGEDNTAPVLNEIGNQSVNEEELLTFTATATDPDLPAQPLSFSLDDGAGSVPEGAAIDESSGVFSWTPTEAQGPGVYTFDVCVGDGLFTSCETIEVTVNEVAVAPVLDEIGNQTVNEGELLSFTVTASDTDLPAHFLSFSLRDGISGAVPPNAYMDEGYGIFSWHPTEAQGPGVYTFDVCVSDSALEDCETINVTVLEDNAAPVLDNIEDKYFGEEQLLIFTATANDSDIPDQALSFSLMDGSSGAVPDGATIDTNSGVFNWTPSEAQGPGTYIFDVCVSDGLLSDCQTVYSYVHEINTAPALDEIGNQNVDEGELLTFNATAIDTDLPAQTLFFNLMNGAIPAGASIDHNSGVFTWTPSESQGSDVYEFDVCVTDGQYRDCETIQITVNEVNVAPVLDAVGDQSVNENALLSFTASAADSDLPAQTLTFSLADGATGAVPDGANIGASNGVFNWSPTEVQGPGAYTFDVCASDGITSTCETIEVTVDEVNLAPALDEVGSKSVNEGELLTFTATAADADLPAQPLSFSLENGTGGPVPAMASIDASTGVFKWTPAEADGPGTYTFDVCASDGLLQDCETIEITVAEVNIAPVLGSVGDKAVDEEELLTFTATAADTDLPAEALSFSLDDGSSGAVPTGASMDQSTGVFSWTPTEAQGPGTYTFDVCVSDGALDDCETIQITVSEVNTAPVLDEIGNKSINEGELLTFTAIAADADIPVQALSYSLEDGTSGAVPEGATVDASSGEFNWTPSTAQGPNTYTFDICISDGLLSDCETIQVVVYETNTAPKLDEISNQTANEGELLTFTATATDSDLPAQPLSFSLEDGTGGEVPEGATIGISSGVFTWTPNEAQGAGTYTFDICVSDGALDDCETIQVMVNEINFAPVLDEIGSKAVDEGEQLSFTATAADADLPVQNLSFGLANGTSGMVPAGAMISTNSGVFTWTPNETQGPGTYTFDVCVTDGILDDCETIQVTVGEVNTAPVLDEVGNQSVNEGELLTFTATAADTDLPAQNLSFSLADGTGGAVPGGATIGASSGIFTWTPTEAQGPGTYTFDVCASDGLFQDCETIQVTVSEVNTAPVLGSIGNQATNEGALLSFTATVTDTDLPGNTHSFRLEDGSTGTVPEGAAIGAGSGLFTWTPTEAQGPGTYTFDVCVSDSLLTDCETIQVVVSEVNTAPALDEIGNKAVDEEELLTFTATAADADIPGQDLTFSLQAGTSGAVPAGATIDASSGLFTWTPSLAQGSGIYTFDVCVSDGLLTDCQTIQVAVSMTNHAPNDIMLSHSSVLENAPANTVVGTLSSTDDNPGDSFTYTLVSGAGSTDNEAFNIDGDSLRTSRALDFEAQSTYSVRVRTTDQGGLYYEEALVISATNVNEAPVIQEGSSTAVNMSKNGNPTPFSLTLNAVDLDSSTLTWSILTSADHGIAAASGTGFSKAIAYIPVTGYVGADSFVVQVTDGEFTDTITVNVTISAVTYLISGNAGVANAVISYAGGSTTASSSGDYSFVVDYGWSGTVTPSLAGYTFTPVSRDYLNIQSNKVNQNYTAQLNTYQLTVNKTGSGTGTVTSQPAGIDCGPDCTEQFDHGDLVTLTATPIDNYQRFLGWSGEGIDCPGTGTCVVTMTAARTVTAEFEKSTFGDVPFDHPRWAYIQALWDNGFTSGCSEDPLLFCPDNILTRAESAVFMLRGLLGNTYTPPTDPSGYVFEDDWSSPLISGWARPFAEGMWDEGLTAGCSTESTLFCPLSTFTRAEGSVFSLRIKYGPDYVPTILPDDYVFGDDWSSPLIDWARPWAEQAYADGLILSCGTDPDSGDPLFCPSDPLDRSWTAYMIVQALDLDLPE